MPHLKSHRLFTCNAGIIFGESRLCEGFPAGASRSPRNLKKRLAAKFNYLLGEHKVFTTISRVETVAMPFFFVRKKH
jgi:hypothetical protein